MSNFVNPWKESPGFPAALIEDVTKDEYNFKLDYSGPRRMHGSVFYFLSGQDKDSIRT